MFVFPAFDNNYKTRKRVFRCCDRCREKRIKCKVSADESIGCESCQKANSSCSLFKPTTNGTNKDQTMNNKAINLGGYSKTDVHSNSEASKAAFDIKSLDMSTVTPSFIKEKFNFNISTYSDERAYQYVFHDHPKVIINNKTTADKSLYHESGIHVDYSRNNREKASRFHIKDRRTFEYLLAINAFSITCGEFAFTDDEIASFIKIYFAKINGILPMLAENLFWDEYKKGILPTILLYSLVLLCSKDNMAEPIMREMFKREPNCQNKTYDENYLEWSFQLDNKIRQVILVLPQLGDFDKYTKLSTSLFLSLYYGFDRFGNEKASHDLTDAVNLAFSLGIHMRRQLSELSEDKIDRMTEIWWCIFVLDRFNALVNCRSLFVRQNDFNVDLPKNLNLLKLVQVARSLENMLYDVYRPFQKNSHKRGELYKIDEFQNLEFQFCFNEQTQLKQNGLFNMNLSTPTYQEFSPIHFISRIVNNAIILAAQKKKFDDPTVPNNIPEAIAYRASQNIMFYMQHQDPLKIINIPIIPWCLTLALAVCLKSRAKFILNYGENNAEVSTIPDSWAIKGIEPYGWMDYLTLLEKFAKKYWVVDEICKLSKDFGEKLEAKKIKQDQRKKRKLNSKVSPTTNSIKNPNTCVNDNPSVTIPNSQENLKKPFLGNNTIKQSINVENVKPLANLQQSPIEQAQSNINTLADDAANFYGVNETNNIDNSGNSIYNDNGCNNNVNPTSKVNTMDFNNTLSYEDYFGSLQIDLFDNDIFMGLPDVQYANDNSTASSCHEGPPSN